MSLWITYDLEILYEYMNYMNNIIMMWKYYMSKWTIWTIYDLEILYEYMNYTWFGNIIWVYKLYMI